MRRELSIQKQNSRLTRTKPTLIERVNSTTAVPEGGEIQILL